MKNGGFAITLVVVVASTSAWADVKHVPTITLDDTLRAACGSADGGLEKVARALALRRLAGSPALDQGALTNLLREDGAPYVWPRAWVASGRDEKAIDAALAKWAAAERSTGERRCGVARSTDASGVVVAAVAVDALANLSPLAMRSHVGAWLTVDSHLLVPATDARAVLIEPDGTTRRLLASFDAGHVLARFAPDRAGAFTVQIVADVEGGPRPVLEARVVADASPVSISDAAPGEKECASNDGDRAFSCILQSIRSQNRLLPLIRDARLDALARAHATAMKRANDVAHDVGDGDPASRFETAGLAAKAVGENVAHAESAVGAVRSLYASPSHRENLLSPELDRFGAAVLTDTDGSVWVVEELAAGLR